MFLRSSHPREGIFWGHGKQNRAVEKVTGGSGPLKPEDRPPILPEKLKSETTLMSALFDLSQEKVETADHLRAVLQQHGFRVCPVGLS